MVVNYTEGRVLNMLAKTMRVDLKDSFDELFGEFYRASSIELPIDFSDVNVHLTSERNVFQLICKPDAEQLQRLSSSSSAWLSLDARGLIPNLMMFSCFLQPDSRKSKAWLESCEALASPNGKTQRGSGSDSPFFCATLTREGLLASFNLTLAARGVIS